MKHIGNITVLMVSFELSVHVLSSIFKLQVHKVKKNSITCDNETVLYISTVKGFIFSLPNSTHKNIVYNPPALETYI